VFSFLNSPQRLARKEAAGWLEAARRVYHFRRDLLSATQLQALTAGTENLRQLVRERAGAPDLKRAIGKLEAVMKETGGRYFPVTTLVENVDFFLVAAIVIFGLRAYFVQPFKIPTNSMWPTYYGVTYELLPDDARGPGWLARAGRFLAFGAIRHTATAPADGEVLVPAIALDAGRMLVLGSEKPGRTFGIFPTLNHEYIFSVNGEMTRFEISDDFAGEFQRLLAEKYVGRPDGDLAGFLYQQARKAGPALGRSTMTLRYGGKDREFPVYWVPLGQHVAKGAPILAFDTLSGDMLFVDRVTDNFFPPKVGQGFVFKTENIHSPHMERPPGTQIRQYYIKRLAGVPGDQLEIRPPVLWRNGQPIEGAAAFGQNARREGLYPGYSYLGALSAGQVWNVPEHSYAALGDNSPDSEDSRAWGFVPEKDVVGRPLFIYYPLTTRWGPAR